MNLVTLSLWVREDDVVTDVKLLRSACDELLSVKGLALQLEPAMRLGIGEIHVIVFITTGRLLLTLKFVVLFVLFQRVVPATVVTVVLGQVKFAHMLMVVLERKARCLVRFTSVEIRYFNLSWKLTGKFDVVALNTFNVWRLFVFSRVPLRLALPAGLNSILCVHRSDVSLRMGRCAFDFG